MGGWPLISFDFTLFLNTLLYRYCSLLLCGRRCSFFHRDHEPPDWPGSQWHQSSDGDCQEGINNLPDQHDQRDDGPPHHLHIQALCAKVDKKLLWRVNINENTRQFLHFSFRILHVNEDFEIMTVSFSDITDNQFAEQLKERLYNHCIRSIYII